MSLRMVSVAACLAGVFGCSGTEDQTSSPKLTGGISSGPVSGSVFPSTVNMNGGCTGTKIGPKHFLFAAHCAYDFQHKGVNEKWHDGKHIAVTNASYPAKDAPSTWIGLTVAHTHFPNSFWNACTSAPCHYSDMITKGADLAIVRVHEETPTIPIAAIDFTRAHATQWAVLNGYGCEQGLKGPNREQLDPNLPFGQLKYQTTAVGADSLISAIDGATPTTEAHWNFFTPGLPLDATSASLCPGDSGGPVYGWVNEHYAVIGVNAAQTSWDSSETSVVNIHARLDTERAWIESVLHQ